MAARFHVPLGRSGAESPTRHEGGFPSRWRGIHVGLEALNTKAAETRARSGSTRGPSWPVGGPPAAWASPPGKGHPRKGPHPPPQRPEVFGSIAESRRTRAQLRRQWTSSKIELGTGAIGATPVRRAPARSSRLPPVRPVFGLPAPRCPLACLPAALGSRKQRITSAAAAIDHTAKTIARYRSPVHRPAGEPQLAFDPRRSAPGASRPGRS